MNQISSRSFVCRIKVAILKREYDLNYNIVSYTYVWNYTLITWFALFIHIPYDYLCLGCFRINRFPLMDGTLRNHLVHAMLIKGKVPHIKILNYNNYQNCHAYYFWFRIDLKCYVCHKIVFMLIFNRIISSWFVILAMNSVFSIFYCIKMFNGHNH
jgi:hypothetical protein